MGGDNCLHPLPPALHPIIIISRPRQTLVFTMHALTVLCCPSPSCTPALPGDGVWRPCTQYRRLQGSTPNTSESRLAAWVGFWRGYVEAAGAQLQFSSRPGQTTSSLQIQYLQLIPHTHSRHTLLLLHPILLNLFHHIIDRFVLWFQQL